MDNVAENAGGAVPTSAPSVGSTLRAELDRRRLAQQRFSLRETVHLMVPLCTQLAEAHAARQTLYVHPSSVGYGSDAIRLVPEVATAQPSEPRDSACMAPELRTGAVGDARSSVFSVGAMLYEMVTGAAVGPGMRRPSELVPGLPPAFETLLGKALVGDPQHRPGDLAALAQALHEVAPTGTIPPPAADVSALNGDDDFEVDVSMSMLPPLPADVAQAAGVVSVPAAPLVGPDGSPISGSIPVPTPSGKGKTERLAELKARLEADPRPRYVVVRGGMDHGPFSAMELLQQIATGSFTADNILSDKVSQDERPIGEWTEFRPFAEQAELHREVVADRKALETAVVAEKQTASYKLLGGAVVLVLLGAAALGWWARERADRDVRVGVSGHEAQSIDFDGGLAGGKKAAGPYGGPWKGGGQGKGKPSGFHPIIPGGLSCEAARNRYVEEYRIGEKGPPDLTAGQYGAVLNRGTYLNACGVPMNTEVDICAAVQNGRAVGVTVRVKPANGGMASCISGQIRSMSFPANPRMDIAYTHFAPQK